MAGVTFYGARALIGNQLSRMTTNYLGQKRGEVATIAIYFFGFFYFMNSLNKIERNDINYLVNSREASGEFFLNTCLHMYPSKVNLELYRQIVLEKQQLQMLRYNHAMGGQPGQNELRIMQIDAQGNPIQQS